MRISVFPDGGGTPLVLSGGPTPAGTELTTPAGFEVEHDFREQVVELLRANEVKVFDRGNHRTLISFNVHNFATDDMGNGISAMYSRAVTDMILAGGYCIAGLIRIEAQSEGSTGAAFYLRGVVKCKAKQVQGPTYNLSFTILGGKITGSATIPSRSPS